MQTVWSWTVHSYSVNCFTNEFSGELLQIQIPFVGYYRRATMYNVTLGIVFTSCLFLTWIMHFVVLFIQEVSKTQIWGNFHLWKTVLNLPKGLLRTCSIVLNVLMLKSQKRMMKPMVSLLCQRRTFSELNLFSACVPHAFGETVN